MVTLQPQLLCASPENTIHPNLRAIRSTGLSSSTLTQLILSAPALLHVASSVPRINFWRDFFGGDEAALLRAFKYHPYLGGHDISRTIAPKISLFQSHGLSTSDIRRMVLSGKRAIMARISLLEDSLKRAKEFGFQPESGMFVPGLCVMVSVSEEALQKRMELFKNFGWSEDEFQSAVRKAPSFVALTENNLRKKINFLVGEARCDSSYIASHPILLMYSLEKRLRPRVRVLNLLESKCLSSKRPSFFTTIDYTDKEFVERFILPHKEVIAGLHEDYLADCA